MKTLLALVIFLVPVLVRANVECDLTSKTWKVHLQSADGGDKVVFTKPGGKALSTWEPEVDLDRVRDCKFEKIKNQDYLILITSHGHAGEAVVVLNPLKKKGMVVYRQTSISDVNYVVDSKTGIMTVFYQDETSVEDPTPVDKTEEWKP